MSPGWRDVFTANFPLGTEGVWLFNQSKVRHNVTFELQRVYSSSLLITVCTAERLIKIYKLVHGNFLTMVNVSKHVMLMYLYFFVENKDHHFEFKWKLKLGHPPAKPNLEKSFFLLDKSSYSCLWYIWMSRHASSHLVSVLLPWFAFKQHNNGFTDIKETEIEGQQGKGGETEGEVETAQVEKKWAVREK